jgi:hypothetical protein
MAKKVEWVPERLSALPPGLLKTLRVNALRYEDHQLVALCDAEIARRVRKPTEASRACRRSGRGRFVIGFHFVCGRDNGVTINPDGTFWTGTWVVDKRHAELAPAVNAYLALHAAKAEPSYRQGIVRAWRKVGREPEYGSRAVKTEQGIDFLVEATDQPYQWIGSGSGEKGYVWGGS